MNRSIRITSNFIKYLIGFSGFIFFASSTLKAQFNDSRSYNLSLPSPTVLEPLDFGLELSPNLSSGLGLFLGTAPQGYSAMPGFSYSVGGSLTFINALYPFYYYHALDFGIDPVFGMYYNSASTIFVKEDDTKNILRLNYLSIQGGIEFPLMEILFDVKIPIFASSSQRLNNGEEKKITIYAHDMNILVEPEISFYYPFRLSNNGNFLIPFTVISFEFMRSFQTPFSLESQSFQSSGSVLSKVNIWTIEIGIKYMFKIANN